MSRAAASGAPADPTEHAAPGRPRSEAVTDRILDVTLELLSEAGVEGTTIHAVADRSGVARATVYLRWPHRDALIAAAVRRAMGRPPVTASGDLEADLRRGAEQARAIFSEPAFLAVFPALVRALLIERTSPGAVTYDYLAPGRLVIAKEYAALAAGSGLRTDVDPELVVGLVIGALLSRLLATGRPPSKADARQAAEIVIAGVRRTHD